MPPINRNVTIPYDYANLTKWRTVQYGRSPMHPYQAAYRTPTHPEDHTNLLTWPKTASIPVKSKQFRELDNGGVRMQFHIIFCASINLTRIYALHLISTSCPHVIAARRCIAHMPQVDNVPSDKKVAGGQVVKPAISDSYRSS